MHERELTKGTHPYADKLKGMRAHTCTRKDNESTHAHSYPNTDSWAERHYGFGCQ